MSAVHVQIAADGGILFEFSYDPALVNLVKKIPSHNREWLQARKAWKVKSAEYALWLIQQVKNQGGYVVGEEKVKAGPRPQAQPAIATSNDDVFGRLLDMVGPAREEKVFQALTKVLHRDVSTGSLNLTATLNRVRDQREGRNCRSGGRR